MHQTKLERKTKGFELCGAYSEDTILDAAEAILSSRINSKDVISSPSDIRRYLALYYRGYKQEVFCVIFLNNKHRILAIENLFYGTIDGASIYPREVVRKVIEHNAAAIILAHNHPSGDTAPSQADKNITAQLKKALQIIDVNVLDHIVVGGAKTCSLAELGWV